MDTNTRRPSENVNATLVLTPTQHQCGPHGGRLGGISGRFLPPMPAKGKKKTKPKFCITVVLKKDPGFRFCNKLLVKTRWKVSTCIVIFENVIKTYPFHNV